MNSRLLRFISGHRLAGLLLTFLTLTIAACSRTSDAPAKHSRGMMGPVSVLTAPVTRQNVPFIVQGLGTVAAANTAIVRTQVNGPLVRIVFHQGQFVQKGQLLAVVDPRPFQIAVRQAQAALQRDQAQWADDKIDLQRDQAMYKQKILALQQLNLQQALVGQLAGTVALDQAALKAAQLNLTYTQITAPISGITGLRQVDLGNIVQTTDTTGIVIITQVQPIVAVFTLPENQVTPIRQAMARPLRVSAYGSDNKTRLSVGRLLAMSNQIDPTTGTIQLKAIFPNRGNKLWPNQFVNIHLRLRVLRQALVVPSASIERNSSRTFVFVVEPNHTVRMQPVQSGYVAGLQTVIQKGLQAGDAVVTDGQNELRPGQKVILRHP